MKDGKSDGFKLYAIRASSVFASLGLLNGDTLQAVNGQELTSADKALDAFTKLASAKTVTLQIVRRGAKVIHTYTLK